MKVANQAQEIKDLQKRIKFKNKAIDIADDIANAIKDQAAAGLKRDRDDFSN